MSTAPCPQPACSLGDGNTDVVFAATPAARGGFVSPSQTPYTWKLVSGSLPTGLTVDPSLGVTYTIIHGTPTRSGTSTFTLQVRDDAGTTARQAFSITIGTDNLDSVLITIT